MAQQLEHRGMGVSPMHMSTPKKAEPAIYKRRGASLPHWTRDGAIYAVTFRLADSLPSSVLEAWDYERKDIPRLAEHMKRPLSKDERNRLEELHSEKIENYLHRGKGDCCLSQDAIASMIANALQFFEGKRYVLWAWCVMPNHLHIVVQPKAPHLLENILHSWKSYTAHKANTLLGRDGLFWQNEYYDHLIRDESDLWHAIEYAWTNPEKAGLKDWKWRWKKTL